MGQADLNSGFADGIAIAYDKDGNRVGESKVSPEGRVKPPLSVPAGGNVVFAGSLFGPIADAARIDTVTGFSIGKDEHPCPHARPSWRMCPHCLGLNAGPGTVAMTKDLISRSNPSLSSPRAPRSDPKEAEAWQEGYKAGRYQQAAEDAILQASQAAQEPRRTTNLPSLRDETLRAVENALSTFYDQGYIDGGNSNNADWSFALTEYCELPEGVDDESPTQVAQYIARLQAANRK